MNLAVCLFFFLLSGALLLLFLLPQILLYLFLRHLILTCFSTVMLLWLQPHGPQFLYHTAAPRVYCHLFS